MEAMTRRPWGNVTLGEYDALNTLTCDDGSRMYEITTSYLNARGLVTYERLRARVASANDEAVLQSAAKEWAAILGTLTLGSIRRGRAFDPADVIVGIPGA